ncbi:MAG: hypothetical protein IKT32_03880, partial [Clostridia bacterium]|nr:hypothetical protein [Clostridia bacterium]
VLGEIGIAGEDAGSFRVEGKGDLNFNFLGDSVRLDANVYVKNLNPTFFYRHFHSKHYWLKRQLTLGKLQKPLIL